MNVRDLRPLVSLILQEYALPLSGHHGVTHWARVLENGTRLAEETGANLEVVRLFAVFHDSRRVNECTDPEHGLRGARLARQLRGVMLDLPDDAFELLYHACTGHTTERDHPNVTVQTCWDADRLDLGRVGITPRPDRLCTDVAQRPEIRNWADGRARFQVTPDFVRQEWQLEL